jgi:hypothetical protein
MWTLTKLENYYDIFDGVSHEFKIINKTDADIIFKYLVKNYKNGGRRINEDIIKSCGINHDPFYH